MKHQLSLIFVYCFLISGCTNFEGEALPKNELFHGTQLCDIVPVDSEIEAIHLVEVDYPQIGTTTNIVHGDSEYFGRNYKFENSSIQFSVFYSQDYQEILFHLNSIWLSWKDPDYPRLYKKGYLRSLYHLAYTNYLVKTSSKRYLVCRTFPADNQTAALHTIYFIIELDSVQPQLYMVGGYGYCDNSIGDFNKDGVLDIVLITQDSIDKPPLDPDNPRGKFSAKIYSINDGSVLPLEQNGEPVACDFITTSDSVKVLEGNW